MLLLFTTNIEDIINDIFQQIFLEVIILALCNNFKLQIMLRRMLKIYENIQFCYL